MMPDIHIEVLGLVFFTALFLSLFFVPATITLARKVGAVDIPKSRSSHTQPTTRLGGLGIATSLVLACLMFLPLNTFAWAFLAGLLVIIGTGLIDDIFDIGPRWKFVGQIAAAGAFIGLGGGSLVHLGAFLGMGEMTLDMMAVPFTIFCMVGGMNAFNLSDGLDGLAGGLAAIAATFFAYFSWHIGAVDLLLVSIALLGAVMGFLRYNSYPAKLFMGDCGSLTLGYVLAAILVSGSQFEGQSVPLVAWVLVVSLPLLDTLLVMARRVRYGHSPFMPDRTHLHHRLLTLGLAHPGVVAVIYAVMAFFGVMALSLEMFPDWYAFAALLIAGFVLFGGVSGLQHLKFSFAPKKKKLRYSDIRKWPVFIQISRWVVDKAVTISVMLAALVCLPAVFLPLPELNRNEVLALLMIAGAIAYYGLHRAPGQNGMLHGAVYVSLFALFFLYNLGSGEAESWLGIYLTAISILAVTWVSIKIIFRRHATVLMPSSFELLMVFLSWFLPFVLFQEMHLSTYAAEAGRLACLQVLPFMLAAKIYFNIQPHANRWVVSVLAGALMVIALRGGLLHGLG